MRESRGGRGEGLSRRQQREVKRKGETGEEEEEKTEVEERLLGREAEGERSNKRIQTIHATNRSISFISAKRNIQDRHRTGYDHSTCTVLGTCFKLKAGFSLSQPSIRMIFGSPSTIRIPVEPLLGLEHY